MEEVPAISASRLLVQEHADDASCKTNLKVSKPKLCKAPPFQFRDKKSRLVLCHYAQSLGQL